MAEFVHKGPQGQDSPAQEAEAQRRHDVDGRTLPSHALSEVEGGFSSHLLPFREDKKAVDLATALVDGDGLLFIL